MLPAGAVKRVPGLHFRGPDMHLAHYLLESGFQLNIFKCKLL